MGKKKGIGSVVEYLKVFLLFVAVASVSGIIVLKVSMYTGGETVNTPDVRGRKIIPALEVLNRTGLNLKVTRLDYDSATPKDRIISQSPRPGEALKSGKDVKVVISRGAKEIIIPNLVGASLGRAESGLRKNEIIISKKIEIYSDSPQNSVLAQKPLAGSAIRRGDSVVLLISAGPPPEYTLMPKFTDDPIADVMDRLKGMDLKISHVSYEPDTLRERGVVIQQNPQAGARVKKGALISLSVSEGVRYGEEKPPTYTILYYTVPDGNSAVKVSIAQDNLDGEREVYNRVHSPGDTISLLVAIKGRTAVKIFLDNELAEVKRY
ncbi:hypothetical protein MNBD_NITROSPINAE01-187 [hydrothermal vent metagenome]|uniref:PASTA domain-containing protein n=1 Tax=hydrothermal vent metagenome TaxID=652676 RepID=A0A3B1C6S4_9ZZZZ